MFLPFHGGFLIRVPSHDHTMKMLARARGGEPKKRSLTEREEEKSSAAAAAASSH
jgi:hypothetical protein